MKIHYHLKAKADNTLILYPNKRHQIRAKCYNSKTNTPFFF